MTTEAAQSPSLCRNNGRTCGACCWGSDVPRASLELQLKRNQRVSSQLLNDRLPGSMRLLLLELLSRRGMDLILAPLLWIPFLSKWIRERLQTRIVCAFVQFEDSEYQQVGCRLHPTRWHGVDLRQASAFRLLHGFSCGTAGYLCSEAKRFAESAAKTSAAGTSDHSRCSNVALLIPDWYDYSKAIRDRSD